MSRVIRVKVAWRPNSYVFYVILKWRKKEEFKLKSRPRNLPYMLGVRPKRCDYVRRTDHTLNPVPDPCVITRNFFYINKK